MKKDETKKLVTYPIVVIESAWPKLPEEAPKIVGENKDSKNLLKIFEHSGRYSGYYKIIPLNILMVQVNSSVGGHKFSIQFDPSYVYIEFDPENFPKNLAEEIRKSALNVDAYNLHVLLGVLGQESPSDRKFESYVANYATIAELVSELDTVTISLISEEDLFDFEQLLRLAGGSFSRISAEQADKEVEKLKSVGLPETFPTYENFGDKILLFRSFISAIGLLSVYDLHGFNFYPYNFQNKNYRNDARKKDLKAVEEFFSGKKSEKEIVHLFPRYLVDRIIHGDLTKDQLIREINKYYSRTDKVSGILPYSMYKTLELALVDILGIQTNIDQIAIAAGIDVALVVYNPSLYLGVLDDTIELTKAKEAVDYLNSLGVKPSLAKEDYRAGINTFYSVLAEIYDRLNENRKILLEDLSLEEIVIPNSSETPYFVLKGHISKINSSVSISEGGAQKTVTIFGEGLELPLRRHTVFFDTASANRFFLQLPTQYAVINSTPIEAAKHILETFMPGYVKLSELSEDEIHEAAQYLRDFDVVINKAGKKIEKGAIILPDLLVDTNKSLIFAPISHVSTSYLNAIKQAFEDIAIYERKAQVLTYAPEGTVASVLDTFLGKSSIYGWFIDEFGNIKTRFELGAAVTPYDTLLSPPVTDNELVQIVSSHDEARVFTSVEVVPRGYSYSSPSEGNMAGVFGRAVAPPVADKESVYKKFTIPDETQKLNDIANWLSQVLYTFDTAVLNALKILKKENKLRTLSISSVFNQNSFADVIRILNDYQGSKIENIFSPKALDVLYRTTGPAWEALVELANKGAERAYVNSIQGYLAFTLHRAFFDSYDARHTILSSIKYALVSYAPKWLKVSNLSDTALLNWIDLLSTFAALGITPKSIKTEIQKDEIKTIINESPIYIDAKEPEKLQKDNVFIPKSQDDYQLPYTNLQIQGITAENTSPDLYLYGLRIHRAEDLYLATLKLTKFRAEFLRKLHEKPIESANLTIIGNPIYKVGNTVLVVTEEVGSKAFIHEGIRKTISDFKANKNKLGLIFNVHPLVEELTLSTTYGTPWNTTKLSYDSVLRHIETALDFILDVSGGEPVPSLAYVPTLGIYETGNQLVEEYLRLLVRLQLPEAADLEQRKTLADKLNVVLGQIVEETYGIDTIRTRNEVLQYLMPQHYLAMQYYIKSVSHNWQIGSFYVTSMNLDYGIPAMLVLAGNDVAGYMLLDGPNVIYSNKGVKNPILEDDHPLMLSLISQAETEKRYFTATTRYETLKSIQKIKRIRRAIE